MSGFVGVLMLDTAFPRVPGDAGNAESYDFPVRIRVVEGAGAPQIVAAGRPSAALVSAFIEAAKALEAEGAVALVSTCGFLIHLQDDIARAVRIPVMVSALSLAASLRTSFGNRRLGILTAQSESLRRGALDAAGIDPCEVRIAGMEGCPAFTSAILAPRKAPSRRLDTAAIQAHCVLRARDMATADPDLAAILLECGNLPPYAGAIRAATGLPVFGILDAAALLWRGAHPSPSRAIR